MSDEDALRGVRYLMNGGLPALSDGEFNKLLVAVLEEKTRRVQPPKPKPADELPCPSCKHGISGHMREKHRSWESRYRPHCSQVGCGCGISQEEIEKYHHLSLGGVTYDQDNAD